MTDQILPIPRQHRAIPIVVSLTNNSTDRLIYSRNYLHLFHSLTNNLTPEVEEGIAQYQLPTQSLVLGETSNLITHYSSAVQDILKKQTQQLLQQLNPVYPYPEGETLDTADLRAIIEAFDEYQPGTIVYIRQTNIATIQFLLPHIVVDLETGIPKVVGLSTLPSPKDYTQEYLNLALLVGSGSIDWTQMALSIASTLSFAMPMPWGIFAAAGFQFFEMLFSSLGGESDLGAVLDQLLKDFVTAVDDVLTIHEIATDAATIQLFASWLQKKLEVMKRLCDGNPDYPFNNEYILGVPGVKGFLEELQEQLTPGGNSITTAVYNLDHLIKTDDYDIFEPSKNTIATISLYVTGISLSLMGQKMVIQLLATVESNYNELAKNCQDEAQKKDYQTKAQQYQDQWRAAYNEFEIQIYGIPSDAQEVNSLKLGDSIVNCSGSVTTKLDEIKANFNDKRLTKIGNTYRYEYTIGSGSPYALVST